MTAGREAPSWTLESAVAEITRLRAELASAGARGAMQERQRWAHWHDQQADDHHKMFQTYGDDSNAWIANIHWQSAAALRAEPPSAAAQSAGTFEAVKEAFKRAREENATLGDAAVSAAAASPQHVCDYPQCSVRGSGHPLACGCAPLASLPPAPEGAQPP